MKDVFEAAACVGDGPCLVLGDFNLQESSQLHVVLTTGRWVNVASVFGMHQETTFLGHQGASRIDYVIANRTAVALVHSFHINKDLGFPGHAALEVRLRTNSVMPWVRQLKPTVCYLPVPALSPDAVPNDVSVRPPAGASFQEVSACVEAFFQHAKAEVPGLCCDGFKHARPNGSLPLFGYGQLEAYSRHPDSLAVRDRRRHRLLRRLEELFRVLSRGSGDLGAQHLQLKNAASRGLLVEGLALGLGTAAQVRQAIDVVTHALRRDQDKARKDRLASWRRALKASQRRRHQWLRDKPSRAILCVEHDGQLLLDVLDILHATQTKWLEFFQRHSEGGPGWDVFYCRYARFLKHSPMTVTPIQAKQLRQHFARTKHSAAGMDGWSPGELAILPDYILQGFADVFNTVEAAGVWPDELLAAITAMLSNGEGETDPLKMRPIAILPALYRAWSSIRFREALAWQESWVHHTLAGGRARHSTKNVYLKLVALIEQSLLDGVDRCGVLLDYTKSFDRVPREIAFRTLDALGLDAGVARALRSFYGGCSRYFPLAVPSLRLVQVTPAFGRVVA